MRNFYLKWPITPTCNLDCIFCNNKRSRPTWRSEPNESDIIAFVKYINGQDAISGMTISGGEPTQAISFSIVTKMLAKRFGFITSGYIEDVHVLDNAMTNPALGFITVSIDSMSKNVVRQTRGLDVLEVQLETLDYILNYKQKHSASFAVYINTIVSKITEPHLENLIIELANRNVNRIQLLKMLSTGSSDIDHKLSLTQEEELDVADRLIEFYINNLELFQGRGFDLTLRFLPNIAAQYFNKKYKRDLPIRGLGCELLRNTINLKTDMTLNVCPLCKTEDWNMIKKSPLYTMKLDQIDKMYDAALGIIKNECIYEDYNSCFQCPSRLKGDCNPCAALHQGNTHKIEIEDCIPYLKMVTTN